MNRKNKINIKVDNVAEWPEQGLVYIGNSEEVPAGIYKFEMGKSEGKNPTPIHISKYRNRIKLSKKALKQIEENLWITVSVVIN